MQQGVGAIALPPNIPHSFRVVGDQPLRLLGTHASPKRIEATSRSRASYWPRRRSLQRRERTSAGRRVRPFLERDEHYWGTPPDDETAIGELERMRRSGIRFVIFAWPAFWWLDHYRGFHNYLSLKSHCTLQNERVVAFDLNLPNQ